MLRDASPTVESLGYIDPEEDDKEDPKEDPSEEHEDEDTEEEDPSKGSDETESFKKDETAITPPPPGHRRARISVRPQIPMAASTQALIDAFAVGSPPFPLLPTSPTSDQSPLAVSLPDAAARPPRGALDWIARDGYGLPLKQ
ncbi:hypothetical protein Tco_0701335 [Tanacetum coccineum]